MKLWIDDIRLPPGDFDLWAKTSGEAHDLLDKHREKITHISFDHDLGGDDTSRSVVKRIEEEASNGVKPPEMKVHSANPVGRMHLQAGIESAGRLYEESGRR